MTKRGEEFRVTVKRGREYLHVCVEQVTPEGKKYNPRKFKIEKSETDWALGGWLLGFFGLIAGTAEGR